ncbi:hypothetical protein C8R46DRAFT_1228275 [Mycena filopes]|nr:hypothetical protein C8R46DRAFT_1228275 [Mycena filopes]
MSAVFASLPSSARELPRAYPASPALIVVATRRISDAARQRTIILLYALVLQPSDPDSRTSGLPPLRTLSSLQSDAAGVQIPHAISRARFLARRAQYHFKPHLVVRPHYHALLTAHSHTRIASGRASAR